MAGPAIWPVSSRRPLSLRSLAWAGGDSPAGVKNGETACGLEATGPGRLRNRLPDLADLLDDRDGHLGSNGRPEGPVTPEENPSGLPRPFRLQCLAVLIG